MIRWKKFSPLVISVAFIVSAPLGVSSCKAINDVRLPAREEVEMLLCQGLAPEADKETVRAFLSQLERELHPAKTTYEFNPFANRYEGLVTVPSERFHGIEFDIQFDQSNHLKRCEVRDVRTGL